MTDDALAAAIAEEAGALLLAIRAEGRETGEALGDRGDREANALILARLAAARPGDFVLSEESVDDRRRCGARRAWIVDPLDGTRDYADGRDDWAVHIGLALDGRPAIGAVAVPERGRVWSTDTVTPPPPRTPGRLRVVASRTRCPAVVHRIADALGAEVIGMGSAGAKAMAVVDGRADLYLHDGGQYEWDNCAPAAVALAAGLHASRLDGSPLVYNCADPLLPDLVICRPDLADRVLAEAARRAA
ncbi:inositol monophosphatase family protein [Sphingomonas rubra]|uniref:3'(2'),5'-bisphosphate nucleotidase n=1 Tax=Sphingomonas rubra TaxID=634430 RepID=A0A1I5PQB7_9SPHN|nr:inositol monophosphatase family protein [Sphingomonas rubra]SFP35746.1 3'(2'),5'-bisphosphate nucleotidase [Sphingomonas rubra]